MKTYKIICSKNNNKITLLNQYESQEEAKMDIGRQGYALIEITELKEGIVIDGIYYFEIKTAEGLKKGKIKSDDVFRAYRKLVDDLNYDVLFIYDRPDATDEYKKLMTINVEKSYQVFLEQSGRKAEAAERTEVEESSLDFFTKKEITRLRALGVRMIAKIENLLSAYHAETENKRNDLVEAINRLRSLSNTNNIDRLRSYGEQILRLIGEVELDIIRKRSIDQKKEFLSETNSLLKGVGSHKYIVHEDDSLTGNLKKLVKPLLEALKKKKKVPKPAVAVAASAEAPVKKRMGSSIREGSYMYYHILKDIAVYQRKKKIIFREYLHMLFRFDREGMRYSKMKLDLISQNIRLLRARLSGGLFSYVKIVQGVRFYFDVIFKILNNFADIFIAAFSLVCGFFVVVYTVSAFFGVPTLVRGNFIFVLAAIASASLAVKLSSGIKSFFSYGTAWAVFFFLLKANF